MINMKSHSFSVLIEKDSNGYFAKCLDLVGCHTQGDTYEEAVANMKEAIALYLEDLQAKNELNQAMFYDQVSLTSIPVLLPV